MLFQPIRLQSGRVTSDPEQYLSESAATKLDQFASCRQDFKRARAKETLKNRTESPNTIMWKATTTLALLAFGQWTSSVDACTMIAAGKNATADGSTLLAHTDDAGGGAADLRLVRVPAAAYPNGSQRAVYSFFGGYPRLVSMDRGVHYQPTDQSQQIMEPLGFIPQVERTYAYFDQDYGLMNEVQLSIAESTCGAKTVGWPSNLPYGKNLFGIAELSKVALERCDSARCAVKTMGDLAVTYGFFSEDSGSPEHPDYMDSAEALGIADRYGEVWVFHVLTGKDNSSAVWAAQRVPDNHVSVVANGFMIRELDLNDTDNYMASDNVISFAEEMGWWHPSMGKFDFTAAYGVHDTSALRPLYTGRRVWRVFDLVAPSLNLDSRLGLFSQYQTYPFSVQPDNLIDVNSLMNILRDYYQGTPYDMSKGVAAGPFGTPMRWDGSNKGVNGGWERPISMFRTVYSFVLQSRGHLPDGIGGVAWYGHGTPHSTVYVPFSCRQDEIPASYLIGKQSEFSQDSAWWAFDFVNNWSMLRFDAISKDIQAKIAVLQQAAFDLRKDIEARALKMSSTAADKYVEAKSNEFASDVVRQWWSLAWQLVSKFSDGYITTGENPQEMQTPGYPAWWLQVTEFAQWPGKTFTPRDDVKHEMEALGTLNVVSPPTVEEAQHHVGVSIAQVGGGVILGALIGVASVLLLQRQRRVGYTALV